MGIAGMLEDSNYTKLKIKKCILDILKMKAKEIR